MITFPSLLFIDAAVSDTDLLLAGLLPEIRPFLLNREEDGITQISRILKQYHHLKQIHIVTHGSPGTLYLGTTRLNHQTLKHYQRQLQTWTQALATDAQILFYGCRLAAEAKGRALIAQLDNFTGGAIAASTTPIGHAHQGGNWQLDFTTRPFDPSPAFTPQTLAVYSHLLAGEVIVGITRDKNNVQVSNYGNNSFWITNTGDQNIAQIEIDITNALYPDTVFDPFGVAGDTVSKPLTINTDDNTGVLLPSAYNPYLGVGNTSGYEGLLLQFDSTVNDGFQTGESLGFSIDADPNSIAGADKTILKAGTNPTWDVGGVSGAELIGSTITVTFTDGTIATGQLQGAGNQGGAQALISQESANLSVSLTVNGINPGDVGHYSSNNPQVIINGTAGQTARIVLTKGFIQPVTNEFFNSSDPDDQAYAAILQSQLDTLAASDFPANNAVEFQTIDVVLTGDNQDISDLFDFEQVANYDFTGEDRLPLGFVASVIDPDNENLPLGAVTSPIYLLPETLTPASSIRINAGGGDYTDPNGNQWLADEYFNGGKTYSTRSAVANTNLDPIFQSERYGKTFDYAIPVATGVYDLSLLFAEIYFENSGARVFDVFVEGQQVQNDLDLFAEVGSDVAYELNLHDIEVSDGIFNVSFTTEEDNAKISGIEILGNETPPPPLTEIPVRINAGGGDYTDPSGNQWLADQYFNGGKTYSTGSAVANTDLDPIFQSERYGKTFDYAIPIAAGVYDLSLLFAEIYFNDPEARVFNIFAEGQLIEENFDIVQQVGSGDTAYQLQLDDLAVEDDTLNISFTTEVNNAKLSGLEILSSDTFSLPPDFTEASIRINAGGNQYTDTLDQVWESDQFFANGKTYSTNASILKTEDDTLYKTHRYAPNLAYDIPVNGGNYTVNLHFAETFFNDFGSRIFDIKAENKQIFNDLDIFAKSKNAFFPGKNSALVLSFPNINVADGNLDLNLSASINNGLLSGIEVIPQVGAQVIVKQTEQDTTITEGGNSDTYSIVLNAAPTNNVTIDLSTNERQVTTNTSSLTFTPDNWNLPQVVTVNAVDDDLEEGTETYTITHTLHSLDANYSSLTVPSVNVSIIDNEVVPISFTQKTVATMNNPTRGAWGQDGRLYVGSYGGQINAYTLDDQYNVIDVQVISSLTTVDNPNILGIAFNPFSTAEQPEIYVAHSLLYANGGGEFPETELSSYSGQISVLSGSDFSTVTPLITGLPVSNHDHGVNGIEFDSEGNLLVSIGGNTNAGVPNDNIGGIPESPFSAAILKAEITKPDFNGVIEYELPEDFVPPEGLTFDPVDSQVFGDVVDVVPGVDVSVYAYGLRNSFDLVWTTKGLLYATDNGANKGFGAVSTSATTQEPFEENVPDELDVITEGDYYGHPNRNLGRYDDRLNVWHSPFEDSIPDVYTAPLTTMPASTNGLEEYRATTFDSQLRGNLLAQQWNNQLFSFKLSPDGQAVTNEQTIVGVANGLDILTGPGGAIVGVDLSGDAVTVATPNDASVSGMTAYDVSPWRAQAGQGFVIGGSGFGTFEDTTVSIGTELAELTYVSETRIKGILPTQTTISSDLLDITVESGGMSSLIPDAFLALA